SFSAFLRASIRSGPGGTFSESIRASIVLAFYRAAACGPALLAVSSFANAQGTGTGSSSSGTAANQCWDLSNNVVRERSGTNATGPSGNSSSTVGSTTSPGSSSSSGAGSGTATSGTSSNADAS